MRTLKISIPKIPKKIEYSILKVRNEVESAYIEDRTEISICEIIELAKKDEDTKEWLEETVSNEEEFLLAYMFSYDIK